MRNKAMERKLADGEALDVLAVGERTEDPQVFRLRTFAEDIDYCVSDTEQWIWSIGRLADGAFVAATDPRFYG
ncbi:MAG: hypothetical protein ACREIS_08165, partial [Nitrospiraceae bacterium]